MKTTPAFPEPNHTQTPNNFFDMIPDMGDAELRVTLVMIRQTFGFHRDGFKMGMGKLAAASGLSRPGAMTGAEEAEKRGTFRRVNPDSQKEAEWELAIDVKPVDMSTQFTPDVKPVDTTPQPALVQVGVKERIKKEKKGDLVDGVLFFAQQAKEQGADKVEEVIQELERGLKVNIDRSLKNQVMAKKIIKDARPLSQWIAWAKADEWRAAHLYLYAKLEKVWQDFPQAFSGDDSMNPQGLQVGF